MEVVGDVRDGVDRVVLQSIAVLSNSIVCLRKSLGRSKSFIHGVGVLLLLDYHLLHRCDIYVWSYVGRDFFVRPPIFDRPG